MSKTHTTDTNIILGSLQGSLVTPGGRGRILTSSPLKTSKRRMYRANYNGRCNPL